MSPLLLLIAIAALAATGSANGVHRLPITRTIVELDWRFASADSFGEYHSTMPGSQQPLVQHSHERERADAQHLKKVPRMFSKNTFSGEDDIDFWSIYTTPIRLGNPPLNLDAIVDTSWSPFFVPSANCTYNAREIDSCIIHPLYNSSLSSTYRADLSPCNLTYWSIEAVQTYGRISEDSLHISGLEIKNQIFEEATQWHPGLLTSDELFDTVLGLALYPTWDDWGNFSAPGPFQNLIKQQLLKENVFSLTLPRTDDDNERGEIVFGGLPENVTREDLIEVPLNDTRGVEGDPRWDSYTSNGWQVLVESISITPASILVEQHIAVVTTSYPYIGLPEKAAKKANQLIGLRDGGTWVDCSTRSSLPDLVIAFGAEKEKQIKLTARDYLLEVYDDIYGRFKCVSTFFSLGDAGDSGIILLGSPFLNGLYSVFDADRKSISFGNRPL